MSGSPKYSSVQISAQAQAAIEEQRRVEAAAEAERRRLAEEAERARITGMIGELRAIAAGLRADAVVMRWCPKSVEDLETETKNLRPETIQAQGAQATRQIRGKADAIVKKANGYQLEADRQSYIAAGIETALRDMGFVVGSPATASRAPGQEITIGATSSSKTIDITVPFQGKLQYDVSGYEKNTASVETGGTAATCDEAESVLNEFREKLTALGVEAGEVQWEGKAHPWDVLRKKVSNFTRAHQSRTK